MKTFIFSIKLMHNPKVIREIEVLENINLYQFAEAIVSACNFSLDHCFGFFSKIFDFGYFDSERKYELFADLIEEGEDIEPTGAESVKKTKVFQVWKNFGDKMLFLFDYGDNWKFIVELIAFGKREVGKKYPKILKKIGKSPKQY